MFRFAVVLFSLWLVNFVGCQCCRMTEHYAGMVDCISDHEHHYESLYSPCYDLNRVGRSDWCSYGLNRRLCQCTCNRCKPAPCGYAVSVETGRVVSDRVSHPDWAEELAPPAEPTEATPADDSPNPPDGLPLSTPPAPVSEGQ